MILILDIDSGSDRGVGVGFSESVVSAEKSTTFFEFVAGELQDDRKKDAKMRGSIILLMAKLYYEKLVLGDLATNCYLVWERESNEMMIIDPADSGVDISEEVLRLGRIPTMILATHGHYDHILGTLDLKLIFNIPFGMNRKDEFLLTKQGRYRKFFVKKIDFDLKDYIFLGEEKLEIIKTPGHTPGGVCFYHQESGLLFSGDTIGGETRHEYSNEKDMVKSMETLKQLPPETLVLPGHEEEFALGSAF